MPSRFFALDIEDAPEKEVIACMSGLKSELVLPCEAVVYSYTDPELDRLSDFLNNDRDGYTKLLNENANFKKKAREINGRVLHLYAAAEQKKPIQKFYTHSFGLEAFEYKYRTFKKYEPRISFSEHNAWSIVLDAKISRKSLNLIVEWIAELGCSVDVQNGAEAKFIFEEPLREMLLASVLTCVIKSRTNQPIKMLGQFGKVLWPPWASLL
jgi:hypothetical protein